MKASQRAWAAAGVVSIAVVVALVWYAITAQHDQGTARETSAAGVRDAVSSVRDAAPTVNDVEGGSRGPRSEVFVLDSLVQPTPTPNPGTVSIDASSDGGVGRRVKWELPFPSGVWTLEFEVGSPDVALRYLDLSGTIDADCHALSATTERGPAPFPSGRFDAATDSVLLEDMPLEVVEALSRARELTLIACDTRFVLDDTQQRVLIQFYVQSTAAILDAVSADAGAP